MVIIYTIYQDQLQQQEQPAVWKAQLQPFAPKPQKIKLISIMIPVWQMMLGVCVGLVALILTRPQALNYHEDGSSGTGGRSKTRRGANTDSGRRPRFNAMPGDNCAICLREMWNDMTHLRCGHALHAECVTECKRHSNICPICRERM